jgi:uncharacterized protein YjbJ (UPF0337 family)
MWNKQEFEGKGKQVKGKVKDKVGEWTGNRDLETEGEAERVEGELQEKAGEVRRKAGEAVEKVGKKIAGK